jgi:hypothetical protein
MRRLAVAATASTAVLLVVWTTALSIAHAQAGLTINPPISGPCQVTATISGEGAAEADGVYTIPHEGSASYVASISTDDEDRPHNGQVQAQTPIPGLNIDIHDPWSGEADGNSDSGTVDWDIPSWVPGGIEINVSGFHNDTAGNCSGSATFKLDGGILDSPAGIASLVLTALFGLGLIGSALPTRP